MLKKIVWLMAVIIALLAVAFLLLRVSDTDPQAMKKKYGTAESRQVADGQGGYIHYRDQGLTSGPALLLVHGANSSLHTWEELVAILSGKYRLISFDQHGHGLTGPRADADYSAAARIDAAIRVLDEVGVHQAIWVGNSMGGWVSWRAGLAVPERVSGLVLIDASGVQNQQELKPYLGARLAQSWLGQILMPYIT
ncbi:MAG: alpha/beta hydrolase, partial [Gammaproteobacteria bacterium]|nr:alpha/beta hydrolase [Gammaproteobacteria bacterium]